jgi:S1/P1 Nuclease
VLYKCKHFSLQTETKIVMRILLIFFFVACSMVSFGWGQTGHRAMGKIAEKYLNKKAKKRLQALLRGEPLAMTTTWMDEIKSDSTFDYANDWHWVTIPNGQTYEQSEKNPKGDVIASIERIIAELRSGKYSGNEEVIRLKMLIHLVGDIHQPLHVGIGPDRGGNNIKVMWFRADSNLHRVWDSDMIDDKSLSYSELAQWIDQSTENERKTWANTNARDWAKESITYRKQVYDYGDGKMGYQYSYKYFDIVKLRLLQSGVRLASLLNEIYGS